MKTRPPSLTCLGLLVWSILASGCSSMPWSDESPRQDLNPTDFSASNSTAAADSSADAKENAAEPAKAGDTSPVAATDAEDAGEPVISPELKNDLDRLEPPSVVAAPPATTGDPKSLTVDAMIGQVNGRPIYASQVLDPLKTQLNAMGQQMSRNEFRSAVSRIVSERLYQIVFDALFLAEAERRMSEQQRFQLRVMMHLNRQELIRKYGAGSEPAADEEMKKKTGRDLDQTLEGIRHTILVRRYQEEVIYPKIAVSKRDVERFYNRPEIFEKYNPKPGRKIRIVMVRSKTNAMKIDTLFAEGKSFLEVAGDPLNQYNRDSGGKMTLIDKNNKETDILISDKIFGPDILNDALAKLKPGEHSPQLVVTTQFGDQYYWIFLEEVIQNERRSLPEVQLEIEMQIRGLQYMMIEQRYRKRLFEDAGYIIDGSTANPLDDMAGALVKIAIGLYTKGS